MKKRFKLITTVASLCLAVALMAFGVYAAQNSSMTVSSKVAFGAQVEVTWGWSVEITGGSEAATTYGNTKAYGTDAGAADWTPATVAGDDGDDLLQGSYDFRPFDNSAIVFTFTCLNTGSVDRAVTVSGAKVEDGENYTVSYSANWDTENTATAGGEAVEFTITFTLTSASDGVEMTNAFNHVFSITSVV